MSITIYGIKSCDTMKKAFAKLNELDVSYDFHDYKKQGIDKATVQRWVDSLGIDKVLNKRGTTWRKLSTEQKQAADTNVDKAINLLVENSSMLKRPIIEGTYKQNLVLLCGFEEQFFNEVFNE